MRFCARPLEFEPRSIYVNGEVLRWSESVTYLGVELSKIFVTNLSLKDNFETSTQVELSGTEISLMHS